MTTVAARPTLTLERIFVSGGHSYMGRHGLGSERHAIQEVASIECVAGRGLRGDRYFDHKENYKRQVTLFSSEVFRQLREALRLPAAKPCAAPKSPRRRDRSQRDDRYTI